tara:strand:+ start:333 stop:464 length:132 start_codon:yes stop_codon:yes gene_type:complete
MPKVILKTKTRTFPYTAKGIKDAKAYAKRTGGRYVATRRSSGY